MNSGDKIRVAPKPQIQIGRLQSKCAQIHLRVVGNELRNARSLQPLERVGDAVTIGARLQRPNHVPKMVCRVTSQFDDFCAVGNNNPIAVVDLICVHKRGVTPVTVRTRNKLEPIRIRHEHTFDANDA